MHSEYIRSTNRARREYIAGLSLGLNLSAGKATVAMAIFAIRCNCIEARKRCTLAHCKAMLYSNLRARPWLSLKSTSRDGFTHATRWRNRSCREYVCSISKIIRSSLWHLWHIPAALNQCNSHCSYKWRDLLYCCNCSTLYHSPLIGNGCLERRSDGYGSRLSSVTNVFNFYIWYTGVVVSSTY